MTSLMGDNDGIDREEREDALPDHERDDDTAVGAGVMGAGGTSVDRGTGTLGGDAQGDGETGFDAFEDDEAGGMGSEPAGDGSVVVPGVPSGGSMSYVPGVLAGNQADPSEEEDEDAGGGR